jgi:hypothetical protein
MSPTPPKPQTDLHQPNDPVDHGPEGKRLNDEGPQGREAPGVRHGIASDDRRARGEDEPPPNTPPFGDWDDSVPDEAGDPTR